MNRLSWIFIGGTFVIVTLFSFFILKPMVLSSYQTYNDNKATQKEFGEVSKKKIILTSLSKNNQLDDLYNIASKYIPVDQNSSALVIEMSAVASQANLKVDQFSLENVPTKATTTDESGANTKAADTAAPVKNTADELKFSMKVSGNFTDFLSFLKNTETSSRLITFNNMSLTVATDVLSVQLSGSAYWKKKSTLTQSLTNVTVSQATIDKFKNLKSYGTPINLPSESGFGRTNPFDAIN